MPSAGDRWVYEARDAIRPEKSYEVVVEVLSASSGGIRETVRPAGYRAVTMTHQGGAELLPVAPGIASFAPYLRAFQEVRGSERWPDLDFQRLWECSANVECGGSARVVGKERVSVKAGTFDAWKIVIPVGMRTLRAGSGGAEFVFWYAESVKRTVKYQSRVRMMSGWAQPNMDMELVSYTPAGAAARKPEPEKVAAEKPAAEKPAAAPAAETTPAAEQVAAVKPAAPAAPARPGWPSVGDRWAYEARDADHPEKKVQGTVEVLSVGASAIRDVYRPSSGGQFGRTWDPGPKLIGMGMPGLLNFVPYMRAFQEIRGGESWSNIEFEHMGNCSNNASFTCSVSGRVVGKERVSVRAGSFDAWKIVLTALVKPAFGSGSTAEFTFWYAEEAKRTVKFTSRFRGGPNPNMDLELISYTPAGK